MGILANLKNAAAMYVMPWAEFNATPGTLADGDQGPIQIDASGNLKVAEQKAPVYEDNTAGRALVEQRNSYANILSTTAQVLKTGAGLLHLVTVNKPVASATITIYDNTAASGTKIATVTLPATLTSDTDVLQYDVAFATGLTVICSSAVMDVTVSFR